MCPPNPQTVEYLYNGILLSKKKEWTSDTCNMDDNTMFLPK